MRLLQQTARAPVAKQTKTTRPRKAATKSRAPKQPPSPPPLENALASATSCAAVSKALQQELQWLRRQQPSACCSEAQLMAAVQRMRQLNWAYPQAGDSTALRSLLQAAACTLHGLSAASCLQLAETVLAFATPGMPDHTAACTLLLQWCLDGRPMEHLRGSLLAWARLGRGGSPYSSSSSDGGGSSDSGGDPSGSHGAPHASAAAATGKTKSLAHSAQAELQPALLRLLRDREAQPWRVAASLRLWSMLRWPLPRALSVAASSALWWHLPRMEAPLVSQAVTAAALSRRHQLEGWQLGKRATQAVLRALLRVLPTAAAPEVADCLLAVPQLLGAEQLKQLAPVAEAALLRVLPVMDGPQLAAAAGACFWGGWQMSEAAAAALFEEAATMDLEAAHRVAPLLRAQLLLMLRTHPVALGRGVAAQALARHRWLLLNCISAWARTGQLDSQLSAALSEALPRMLTGAPPQQVAVALRMCWAAGWAEQLRPGVMELMALWLAAHRLQGSWPPRREQRSGSEAQ